MKDHDKPRKIAVIGAGISGITAAYLLQKKHRVTLFEKNEYFGGHTNTVTIQSGPDAGTPVDTGFIVLNYRTYPNFIQFLEQLSVETERTDMSFSYYDPGTGLSYATRNLNTLFAQRANFFKPWYWQFLFEIKRFLLRTREDYYGDRLEGLTLGEYLHKLNYSDHLIYKFIVPWSAAIWSAADFKMLEFPMKTFAQFYENHGLLSVDEAVPWYFVKGGSQTYVNAFLKTFQGKTYKEKPVKGVKRNPEVTVTFQGGIQETFDKVVIATHADEALRLLEDPSEDEKRLLGGWRYSQNKVFLHTDTSWMPTNRRSWASWNYIKIYENKKDSPITLTYHMNRLQNLNTQKDYLVTLNPSRTIKEAFVIKKIHYTHPLYSFSAFESQKELANLNGANNTFFCGSYFGYGFHEDGVKSALEVGKHFGTKL
jgi:predicted NAD/FAD-binding protein